MVDEEKPISSETARDFVREIVGNDIKDGLISEIVTRFPPEPNGCLHLGHAKSICLNFELATEVGGRCNLRFDDTNPVKEEEEYIESIQEDIKWLGFDWGENIYFASDNFDQLYQWAEELIKLGRAYVDDLSADEIRESRGTLKKPGSNSPFRERAIDVNLDLFRRMKRGEFNDGKCVLRAKIDMESGNINLRDPVIYRILHSNHPRTSREWCIYPNYDFAHGQSDALEGVTHSICTLEFEDHRPLYEWFLNNLPVPCKPKQIEFSRLNLSYTVLSKRKLKWLVEEGHVTGWDDPRMPTLSGVRRRGVPPEAIRDFSKRIGVTKSDGVIEYAYFEHCIREFLNKNANRRMAVLKPIKVIIENFPEGISEELDAVNNPEDLSAGTRKISFSRELFIENDDFMENPPKNFFRLGPGREVRLRYAYFVTCTGFLKNDSGEVIEVHCKYDPKSRGGNSPDGRKVKGTIHWVSVHHSSNASVNLYEHLFSDPVPESGKSHLIDSLNPNSLEVLDECKLEVSLRELSVGEVVQFERLGYFCLDKHSSEKKVIFNRTLALRDTWAKIKAKI